MAYSQTGWLAFCKPPSSNKACVEVELTLLPSHRSALFTVTPMSIFAQNNGVIALTRCANRRAGAACAIFLIIFGILGKISGVFLSIPNPV